MNILLSKCPTCITVGEKEYAVKTDFKVWIAFELKILNFSDSDDIVDVVYSVFESEAPPPYQLEATAAAVLSFYQCGSNEEKQANKGASSAAYEILDYNYDADYIYSAFYEQYGIDLQESELHWWKFRALFKGLSDNVKITQIMAYRAVEITADMPSAEQNRLRKLKKMYEIPASRQEQEKNDEIARMLINGGDPCDLL